MKYLRFLDHSKVSFLTTRPSQGVHPNHRRVCPLLLSGRPCGSQPLSSLPHTCVLSHPPVRAFHQRSASSQTCEVVSPKHQLAYHAGLTLLSIRSLWRVFLRRPPWVARWTRAAWTQSSHGVAFDLRSILPSPLNEPSSSVASTIVSKFRSRTSSKYVSRL